MLATPHLLTGAAIGILFGSLPAVIVIAFLSHFALDAIPHTETSTFRPIAERDIDDQRIDKITYNIAYVDVAVGMIALTLILSNKANIALPLAGAGAAILIDVINHVPLWKKYTRELPLFKQVYQFHKGIHYQLLTKFWPVGIITQIVVIGVAIWVLLSLK